MAFSTNSLTALAGRSTTSPAAMRLIVLCESLRMIMWRVLNAQQAIHHWLLVVKQAARVENRAIIRVRLAFFSNDGFAQFFAHFPFGLGRPIGLGG
jgi:hypothetical protein